MKCSIIIPTRNRPAMLSRAVRSALDALPPDGEVIVVDDGSEQPAEQSLGEIEDDRLAVLQNGSRSGGSSARNFGFSRATGEVLFFLDDDDEMLPHYCRYVLDVALRSDPSPDYGFSAIHLVKAGSPPQLKRRNMPEGLVSADTPFRITTFPFSIGLWMTRGTYKSVGPIDETMPTNSDTDYSCRLRAAGKRLWYSAEPGVRIHAHGGQDGQLAQVTKRTPNADRAAVFRRIIERHASYLTRDSSTRSFLLQRHLKLAAKAEEPALNLRSVEGLSLVERLKLQGYYGSFCGYYALRRMMSGK